MGFNHWFSCDFLHFFLLLVGSLSDTKLQAFAAIKFKTAPAFQKIALFFNLSIRLVQLEIFVFVLNVLNTEKGPQYSKEKFRYVAINNKTLACTTMNYDLNMCCETVKISQKIQTFKVQILIQINALFNEQIKSKHSKF